MNYDDWLEAPYQQAEATAYAIDSITEDLLSGDFSPENIDNFLEAIAEGALETDAARAAIAPTIEVGQTDFALIGKAVWNAVYSHIHDKAAERALEIYNNGPEHDDY